MRETITKINLKRNQKGITLIALIVTIIVVLIIAGVAISVLLGENGILKNASKAKTETEIGLKEEIETLDELELLLGSQETPWNENIASSFAGGDGTELSPYLIENAQQLAYFAKQVNDGEDFEGNYIKIINDIDLGYRKWTPIGLGYTGERTADGVTTTTEFKGDLDGDGHVISNLNIQEADMHGVGLVGVLGEKGTVENIKVSRGRIIGRSCVAGIIGLSKGDVINCSNSAEVISKRDNTDNSGRLAGGIVGALSGQGIVIKDCINNGKILSVGQQAGGIVGGTEFNQGDFIIQDCTNTGKVVAQYTSIDENSGAYSGGIIGTIIGTQVSIIRCDNQGEIVADVQATGGIAGYTLGVIFNECNNYGNVTVKYREEDSSHSGLDAGGIIGQIDGENVTITKCNNNGEITSESERAGGIVGYVTTASTAGNITECDNFGKVVAKYVNGNSDSGKNAAGIVAKISGTIDTTNCNNKGEIIAENQYAGGIVGVTANGDIDSCVNTGIVMAKYVVNENALGTYAGGIVGRSSGADVLITNSSNEGYVIAERSGAGGIVGIISKGTIRWCKNSENIAVNSNGSRGIVGGIAGMNSAGIIEKCYNTGKITNKVYLDTTIESSGGILGALASTGKVQYCYNNCEFEGGDISGAIVGQFNNSSTASVTKCYYTGTNIKGIGSKGTDDKVITETVDATDITDKVDAIDSYENFKVWIETK